MTRDKDKNNIEQKRREWREHLHKAIKENNSEESARALLELNKLSPAFWDEQFKAISQRISKIGDKVCDAEQRPNLARCIIATMEELKDMGLWDKETNSTYELAEQALQSYKRTEKKRTDYLAAKTAYEKALNYYTLEETRLAFNLISKFLDPLGGTALDPLKWFLPADRVIATCNLSGVQITVSTLRKYQRLGLIPKPIRLGRKAHYSLLTVIRVLAIDKGKKDGLNLRDLKASMKEDLKATLAHYDDKYPGDRSWVEDGCVWMGGLTLPAFEELAQGTKEAHDKFFDAVIKRYEEGLHK